ncbi:MAG: hypothetical protein PCALPYG88_0103 [uncultured Paraburkholderia sp.]|nr:MAG: hypothetical protein PCALPYG08_0105 [uncultured Paraburkholderia sp.]CAH2907814.1 MAG: hypothetical protein PCALPYG88_0103 [uncultured Paraburkholderia sp.]
MVAPTQGYSEIPAMLHAMARTALPVLGASHRLSHSTPLAHWNAHDGPARLERCRDLRTEVKYRDSRPAQSVHAMSKTGRFVLIQFVSVGGMRTGHVPGEHSVLFLRLIEGAN